MLKYWKKVVVYLLVSVLLPLGGVGNIQDYAKAEGVVNEPRNKINVNISGVSTPDSVYTGQPYVCSGAAVVEDIDGKPIPNVNLVITYSGTCVDGSSYNSSVAPTDVGDYMMNIAVAPDNPNYSGSSSMNFHITKREVTVTANDYKINVADAAPVYDSVIVGLASNDHFSNITYQCEYSPGKSGAGTYAIEPRGGNLTTSKNYQIIYKEGYLTVNKLYVASFTGGTGVVGIPPTSINAAEGTLVYLPTNTQTKNGCTFGGWQYNSKIYQEKEAFQMPNKNVEFSAVWVKTETPKIVTDLVASYSEKAQVGDSLNTKYLSISVTYKDGSKETLNTGYTIENYYIKLGINTLKVSYGGKTALFTVNGINRYTTYNVSFESTGGTYVSTQRVYEGSTISIPTPTRWGYTFAGWFTSPGGYGDQLNANTIILRNTTYYAYWMNEANTIVYIQAKYIGKYSVRSISTADFEVTAYYANNTASKVTGFSISQSSISYGSNYVTVTYKGFQTTVAISVTDTLISISARLKGKEYLAGNQLSNNDVIVTAKYIDGTSKEVTDFTIINPNLAVGSNTITITYASQSTSILVYANACYTVYFDSKGGSTVPSRKVVIGKTVGTLPTPTRDNFTFMGWYRDSSCTIKFDSNTAIYSNMTLYALWKSNQQYTINYSRLALNVKGKKTLRIHSANKVYWKSSNKKIAVVNQKGIVTGIKKGTVTITGKTDDGYVFTCKVTVRKVIKKINTKVSTKKVKNDGK